VYGLSTFLFKIFHNKSTFAGAAVICNKSAVVIYGNHGTGFDVWLNGLEFSKMVLSTGLIIFPLAVPTV
jgi:hypothetical protein